MEDVLDKIRKALAMTTSSSEAEARTAAKIAADLIRKHNVKLSLGPTPSSGSFRDADLRAARQQGYNDGIRVSSANEYQRGYYAGCEAERQRKTTSDSQTQQAQQMDRAILLTSEYKGSCRVCGGPYKPGDSIWWRRGRGAAHERCATSKFGS